MAELEKFSFTKLFGSFVQFIPWVKALSIGVKIVLVLIIALTIYRAYFMPTHKTDNKTTFTGSVGKVEIKNESAKQKNFYAGIMAMRSIQRADDYFGGVEFGILF